MHGARMRLGDDSGAVGAVGELRSRRGERRALLAARLAAPVRAALRELTRRRRGAAGARRRDRGRRPTSSKECRGLVCRRPAPRRSRARRRDAHARAARLGARHPPRSRTCAARWGRRASCAARTPSPAPPPSSPTATRSASPTRGREAIAAVAPRLPKAAATPRVYDARRLLHCGGANGATNRILFYLTFRAATDDGVGGAEALDELRSGGAGDGRDLIAARCAPRRADSATAWQRIPPAGRRRYAGAHRRRASAAAAAHVSAGICARRAKSRRGARGGAAGRRAGPAGAPPPSRRVQRSGHGGDFGGRLGGRVATTPPPPPPRGCAATPAASGAHGGGALRGAARRSRRRRRTGTSRCRGRPRRRHRDVRAAPATLAAEDELTLAPAAPIASKLREINARLVRRVTSELRACHDSAGRAAAAAQRRRPRPRRRQSAARARCATAAARCRATSRSRMYEAYRAAALRRRSRPRWRRR